MPIKRFEFEFNSREVIEVVTASGTTGYIDASVPVEALLRWRRRLDSALKRRIGQLRYHGRREKRRRLTPTRMLMRRPKLKKRYRGPVRYRTLIPRR